MPRTKKTTTETAEAVKTVAKKAKSTAAAKTAEAKAVVAAKTEETKAAVAEATTAVKRATCKVNVCVEMNGVNATVNDIQKAVKADVKARGLVPAELNIYINAQEQAAYYTVDGDGNAEYKVDLKTL